VFSEDAFLRRHKILSVLLLLLVLIAVWLYSRTRGPHPEYNIDFTLPAAENTTPAAQLHVGVAKRDVTPIMDNYDPWTDVNGNGKFEDDIDTYTDRNGNGKFDPVWIAGFNTNRPAQGVNDPQWVRAIALRNNGVTLVLVTIDSIGIFHNEYVTIRKSLDPALGIDHVMFSATHCHEVVDMMKIWSGNTRINDLAIPILGFDRAYTEFLQAESKAAIEEAVANLAPADMYCAQVEIQPEGFVNDSRKPEIMDNNMYLFRFNKPGTEETIATFVNWGNHPESLGGDNPMLTSDFPHWLREGVEKGVPEPNGAPGIGGMCLYFQGQVGGLMTQLHTEVPHRDGSQKFKDDTFEKAESLGYNLALVALDTLRSDRVWKNETPRIAVAAKTIYAPMEGQYKWIIMLGFIHEGYRFGKGARTEMNAIRIGEVSILAIPGEIYPEIVEGGVEALPGRDFDIMPVETPGLRTFMEAKARMGLVVGLANDAIGYIIPKSQWDNEAPWTYGTDNQYGEENSGGPEVGPMIYREGVEMMGKINEDFDRFPAPVAAAPAPAPAPVEQPAIN
jgi:hypothetical protein